MPTANNDHIAPLPPHPIRRRDHCFHRAKSAGPSLEIYRLKSYFCVFSRQETPSKMGFAMSARIVLVHDKVEFVEPLTEALRLAGHDVNCVRRPYGGFGML